MATTIDPEKCTGCEECVESCPSEAISIEDGIAVVDEDNCSDCGTCVDVCPSEAITIE